MDSIICSKCGVSKQATTNNFYIRKDTNTFRRQCISCIVDLRKQYYKQNKESIKERYTESRPNRHNKIIQFMRQYNSLPEVKKRMNKYRVDNRKSLRKKEKEWRVKNPEKAREIARRKQKKRMQNPMVRIRFTISRAIGIALNRAGSSKAGESIMKYLPYNVQDLKKHLESSFEPWMNWNNYGRYMGSSWNDNDPTTWTWQIDHIIPQSDLPYQSMRDENFLKAWSLDNLRPLSAKRNCLDGSNRIRHKGKI